MPKIHPNGLIFYLNPITIKPHTVKVCMKRNICVTSFLGKINFKRSTLIALWPRSHKVTSRKNGPNY